MKGEIIFHVLGKWCGAECSGVGKNWKQKVNKGTIYLILLSIIIIITSYYPTGSNVAVILERKGRKTLGKGHYFVVLVHCEEVGGKASLRAGGETNYKLGQCRHFQKQNCSYLPHSFGCDHFTD